MSIQKNAIKDISLAPSGERKIEWVKKNMPVLSQIEEEFIKTKPFQGLNVAISIHLEAKTAYLAKVMRSGGANVAISGSNPLSTQDDVAAALAKSGISVYSWYDATEKEYFDHLNYVLDHKPNIVIDDGGDLVNILHSERTELIENIIGGSEETTTGVIRLKAREEDGSLKFPMISVNDAYCKYLFDNRYGTGQSVWDGIMRTTNLMVAGTTVVVAGYGWCGRGVALKAKGLGARVVVTEIDPIKAIEAVMDGFDVMPSTEAAKIGDYFITVTGCMKVFEQKHFELMKDGAILSNAGHFDVEIWVPDLEKISTNKKLMRNNIMGYKLENGNTINLIAGGRLVNLASGDGHPAEIMDMSFALQALSAQYIAQNRGKLKNIVYNVPEYIDKKVAWMKLNAMGFNIDTLSKQQQEYLKSWNYTYSE